MHFRKLESEEFSYPDYLKRKLELLNSLNLTIRDENSISDQELKQIISITNRETNSLEPHEKNFFIDHAKNWVLKLYNNQNELKGFIFAHDGIVEDIEFYERGTLWIDRDLRAKWYWLWKLLMLKMTEKLEWKSILSVTANAIVQTTNMLIMDHEIINPRWVAEKIVLHGGPIDDTYRIFTNTRLMNAIKNQEKTK